MVLAQIKSALKFFSLKLTAKPALDNLWSGDYSSWNNVVRESGGYDSQAILEVCRDSMLKVKNGEALYERDGVLFDQVQHNWSLLASLQKAALSNHGKLSVLDFGGSLGSSYFQCRAFLSELSELKWTVVEQAHFVNCGKKHFENEELTFHDSLESSMGLEQPNLVLLSGVLQYLERPYEMIQELMEIKCPYIILDRTGFINAEQGTLTIQNVPESIYKASYPCWFFNEAQLKQAFEAQYELLAEFPSVADGDKKDDLGRKLYWKGFFFQKK